MIWADRTSHSVKSSRWPTNLTTLRAVATTVITLKIHLCQIIFSNQFQETNAKDGGVEGEATDRGEARLLIAHGFCQISLKRRSNNTLTWKWVSCSNIEVLWEKDDKVKTTEKTDMAKLEVLTETLFGVLTNQKICTGNYRGLYIFNQMKSLL